MIKMGGKTNSRKWWGEEGSLIEKFSLKLSKMGGARVKSFYEN
jgi:hypothetical protein